VNFTDPLTAFTACKTMDGCSWKTARTSRVMKLVPANVQGLAANLKRYSDSETEPDSSHSPLFFHRGVNIPLQIALQIHFPMNTPLPQWLKRGDKEKEDAWSLASTAEGHSSRNSHTNPWEAVGQHSLVGETAFGAYGAPDPWHGQPTHCRSTEHYGAKTLSFDYLDTSEFMHDGAPKMDVGATGNMQVSSMGSLPSPGIDILGEPNFSVGYSHPEPSWSPHAQTCSGMSEGIEKISDPQAIMKSPGYVASSKHIMALLCELKAHGL